MKAWREFRGGLLAFALLWAASTPILAESAAPQSPAPSYEDIVALARSAGEVAPSLLAYRLVFRFSRMAASNSPGETLRLAKEADLALRFGTSPQEIGLRLKRNSAAATRKGPVAEGMLRLMREETARSSYPGAGFGGPERGAGRLGPGIGRLSWSAGSGTTSDPGLNPGSQPIGGGSPAGGTTPGGGSSSGKRSSSSR